MLLCVTADFSLFAAFRHYFFLLIFAAFLHFLLRRHFCFRCRFRH